MIPTLYRGSVKDVLGPVDVSGSKAVVFEYTDAYSVFDWGRMPDLLTGKGEALATLAAHWFEKLEQAETWRDFSKTSEALKLRKGNRFGAAFNEIGERLQAEGLRTHYLGVMEGADGRPAKLSAAKAPVRRLVARQVSVVKPVMATVLGRQVPDYLETRGSPAPRLVPLEVVFRFSCPPGSSLLERAARDAGYLASIGYAGVDLASTQDFPILEMFTKLEPSDRPLSMTEALAISGVSSRQLSDLLLKTAWIAGYLRSECARQGIELADGKVEWGVAENGDCFLVDAIGPDELRILKDGVQLSKEFMRTHYRATPWFEAVGRAKTQASREGLAEWKRLVMQGPPALPASHRELGVQLYLALTNALTGRSWFSGAWGLDRVVSELRKVQ